MKKILNNKGFTLVELLAVLVILVAIMGISIPTISSSLERTRAKQDEARKEIIESAAEQYVTDNKNAVYSKLDGSGKCKIQIAKLDEYLSAEEMKSSDDVDWSDKYVVFTKPSSYEYSDDASAIGNTCY